MTPVRRWALVAVVVIVVGAGSWGTRWLPVAGSGVSSSVLLERVQGSAGVSHSGYAETTGDVLLPVGDELGDVGTLLGDRSRLRVWWQDDAAWRVDRLLVAGESDLVHQGSSTIAYDYEDRVAVRTSDPEVRLPRSADLLPPQLARTALAGADVSDVVRLDERRVAGIDAPGLRFTPSDQRTTIDHVDVWAEPDSGLPLRVEVYSGGSSSPDLTTFFDEVDLSSVPDTRVSFSPSPDVALEDAGALDIADAASRYAPFRVPDELAGLQRTAPDAAGAVGVYGDGVTRFIAIPLRDQEADPLRDRLVGAPGAVPTDGRTVVTAGPLTVLLTGGEGDGGWLVAGSVTPETLGRAADRLVRLDVVDREG